jgi:hypothetical protein
MRLLCRPIHVGVRVDPLLLISVWIRRRSSAARGVEQVGSTRVQTTPPDPRVGHTR